MKQNLLKMKLLVTLLIGMFIHSSKAYSPYSHWKDRMSAYGSKYQVEIFYSKEVSTFESEPKNLLVNLQCWFNVNTT